MITIPYSLQAAINENNFMLVWLNRPLLDHGIVRVYQQNAGNWALVNSLVPSDTRSLHDFGAAMAMSADGATILIGAPGVDAEHRSPGFHRLGSGV